MKHTAHAVNALGVAVKRDLRETSYDIGQQIRLNRKALEVGTILDPKVRKQMRLNALKVLQEKSF